MLGDTGIGVHPHDPRYKDLVGQKARHPFIDGRELLIFADEDVDMDLIARGGVLEKEQKYLEGLAAQSEMFARGLALLRLTQPTVGRAKNLFA